MKWYLLATPVFESYFSVKGSKIVKTDPSLKRFEGQLVSTLFNWLDSTFKNYNIGNLDGEPKSEGNNV